jgi:hypothetical protein
MASKRLLTLALIASTLTTSLFAMASDVFPVGKRTILFCHNPKAGERSGSYRITVDFEADDGTDNSLPFALGNVEFGLGDLDQFKAESTDRHCKVTRGLGSENTFYCSKGKSVVIYILESNGYIYQDNITAVNNGTPYEQSSESSGTIGPCRQIAQYPIR